MSEKAVRERQKSVCLGGTLRKWRQNSVCLLAVMVAAPALAVSFRGESETMLRTFERSSGSATNQQVIPIYEYFSLDVEQIGSETLSFYLYGWGRFDAADSGYYDEPFDGELIYGYLEWTDEFQGRSLRIGRQHIYDGVANESIDGVRLMSDLGNQFSVTAFGGLPVGYEETGGRAGDTLWGGRLAHHAGSISDIGVSYMTIENDGATVSTLLGLETLFFLPMNMYLQGNSVRNIETGGWAEHNYALQINAGAVTIRPHYESFNYADYFDTGPTAGGPFLFLAGTDEQLTAGGLDLSWRRSERWTFDATAKRYSYDLSDPAQYLSASATWYGDAAAQVGGEVGLMQGDTAESEYTLLRLFGTLDELTDRVWVDSINGDVLYTLYGEDIYGKSASYFVSLGSSKRFMKGNLEITLSADYSMTPYYDSDFRTMMTATYKFGKGS